MSLPARSYYLVFALLCFTISLSHHLIYPRDVGATTLVYRSVKDLAQRSVAVIVAQVEKTEPFEGATGIIYTRISFAGVEPLLGDFPGDSLHLELPGGNIGGKIHDLPGVPLFTPGERVILFLKEVERFTQIVPIRGWSQGVFRVKPEDDTVHTYEGRSFFGIDAQGESRLSAEIVLPGIATHPGRSQDIEIVAMGTHPVGEGGIEVAPEPVPTAQARMTPTHPTPIGVALTVPQFRELLLSLRNPGATPEHTTISTKPGSTFQFGAGQGASPAESKDISSSRKGAQ